MDNRFQELGSGELLAYPVIIGQHIADISEGTHNARSLYCHIRSRDGEKGNNDGLELHFRVGFGLTDWDGSSWIGFGWVWTG